MCVAELFLISYPIDDLSTPLVNLLLGTTDEITATTELIQHCLIIYQS